MADLLALVASTQTALLDIVRQLAVGVGPYEYAGLIVNVRHLEWVVRHLDEAGAEFTRIAALVQTQHPDHTI
jgi:hypothetical protein